MEVTCEPPIGVSLEKKLWRGARKIARRTIIACYRKEGYYMSRFIHSEIHICLKNCSFTRKNYVSLIKWISFYSYAYKNKITTLSTCNFTRSTTIKMHQEIVCGYIWKFPWDFRLFATYKAPLRKKQHFLTEFSTDFWGNCNWISSLWPALWPK